MCLISENKGAPAGQVIHVGENAALEALCLESRGRVGGMDSSLDNILIVQHTPNRPLVCYASILLRNIFPGPIHENRLTTIPERIILNRVIEVIFCSILGTFQQKISSKLKQV